MRMRPPWTAAKLLVRTGNRNPAMVGQSVTDLYNQYAQWVEYPRYFMESLALSIEQAAKETEGKRRLMQTFTAESLPSFMDAVLATEPNYKIATPSVRLENARLGAGLRVIANLEAALHEDSDRTSLVSQKMNTHLGEKLDAQNPVVLARWIDVHFGDKIIIDFYDAEQNGAPLWLRNIIPTSDSYRMDKCLSGLDPAIVYRGAKMAITQSASDLSASEDDVLKHIYFGQVRACKLYPLAHLPVMAQELDYMLGDNSTQLEALRKGITDGLQETGPEIVRLLPLLIRSVAPTQRVDLARIANACFERFQTEATRQNMPQAVQLAKELCSKHGRTNYAGRRYWRNIFRDNNLGL